MAHALGRRAGALAIALVFAFSGCGGDDEPELTRDTANETQNEVNQAIQEAEAKADNGERKAQREAARSTRNLQDALDEAEAQTRDGSSDSDY